jgi:hypothetical protein
MTIASSAIHRVLNQIKEYRQKYYQNQLLKGLIFTIAVGFSTFILISTLEYYGRFNSSVRAILFFTFILTILYSSYQWFLRPLISLYGLRTPLTDEHAARQIGAHFPEIGDKLLNTLQLGSISGAQTDLIEASIQQKSKELLVVRFSEAIHFNENKRYLNYAIGPVVLLILILFLKPAVITKSSDRIIHFKNEYNDAPFSFVLTSKTLKAYRNEDFNLTLKLTGEALPQQVYLVQNGTRFKLTDSGKNNFTYEFKNLQRDLSFSFEAAGFHSESYKLLVVERPSLLSFDVSLVYPAYLKKPAETLTNVGNLTIPEGTRVEWNFKTSATKNLALAFEGEESPIPAKANSKSFAFDRTIRKSGTYSVELKNEDSPNSEKIGYYLNVVPDRHPEISLENFQDTTLYNFLVLGGGIKDDYGFTRLQLVYTLLKDDPSAKSKNTGGVINIPFNKTTNTQSFYFQWFLDSLQLSAGDKIEYYAQVWDNDGINGPKSTRSETARFHIPSKDKLEAAIDEQAKKTEQQIKTALRSAQSLEKDLKNLENRLKSNKDLDYQEQKQAEEILKKRDALIEQLKALQEENRSLNEKSQQFKNPNQETQKKLDQLQKIMNELMNDETSKLYQELQKMLEQKQSERMTKLLEKIRNKEKNSEKELERTLTLFKKLQLEQKLSAISEDLKDLADEQEKLSNENEPSEKSNNEENVNKNDELKEAQKKIAEEFEKAKEDLKEAKALSQEIKENLDTQEDQQKEISKELEKSAQQLNQKQTKEAKEAQKKAAKSMKQLSKSLAEEMKSMEMQEMQTNIDGLRDLLENLIRLSFDQEKTMKAFRGVRLQDPRFVSLGQDQLKLQDDAKIIEDSLYALANRITQIQSFITREVGDMKQYMADALTDIRDRQLSTIATKQQFAMTAINNLALMLSDVFRQMQQQMAMAMSMPGKGKEKGKSPSPSELQQQLNSKLQQMKQGQGAKGQSEQLARMAAEQAQIRKMIQELLDAQKGTELGKKVGAELKELANKMDQSETDLVNKRINPELIKRNQEIATRLLESEKAMREQEEDIQRKGETAKWTNRKPPAQFQEYLKQKQKHTELLRSVPPTFSPYYKREVDAYFNSNALQK